MPQSRETLIFSASDYGNQGDEIAHAIGASFVREADSATRHEDILANLVHDLRSPLSSIRTGIEVLKLSRESPHQVDKIIAMLERQTTEIARLLHHLEVLEPLDPKPENPHFLHEIPPAEKGQRKVLVVDDSRSAADILTLFFQMEGLEVRSAYGGEDALDLAREMKPDVIFLDLGLPDVSGYEVASKIRQSPDGGACYIVALTGRDDANDRKNIADAGFDLHIVKPPEPGILRKVLKQSSLAKAR